MAFQLQELGGGVGYFKGGLYGNAKAGKTHTATEFAIGIRRHMKLDGPIGFFDTETGLEYVRPLIVEGTGKNPVGGKSKALGDAIDFLAECVKAKVSVAIIDSMTHIWEEVQKTFLKNINATREKRGLNPKTTIEWQDRGPLNDIWQKLTDSYVNGPLHVIVCGRAANIWEMSTNDEGKKELNKIGTKMKTQSEMAYEPSFLAELAREQEYVDGKQIIFRTMTVLGDRFRLLDGKQFRNPTFKDILPHIEKLTPGANNVVDTSRETQMNVTDEGNAEWNSERRQREIFCEEIQGLLTSTWPGQSAEEKKFKVDILFELLGSRAWPAISVMDSAKLKRALDAMPEKIKQMQEAKKSPAQQVVEHFTGEDKKGNGKPQAAKAGKETK